MRNKYTSDPKKRQIAALIIAAMVILANGYLVVMIPPNNIWVEVVAVLLFAIWMFLVASWIAKNKRWGGVVTIATLYLLIMNRIGYLNWISFGVLLVLVGLISLIN